MFGQGLFSSVVNAVARACCCSRRPHGAEPLPDGAASTITEPLLPVTVAAPGPLVGYAGGMQTSALKIWKKNWPTIVSTVTTTTPYVIMNILLFLLIGSKVPQSLPGAIYYPAQVSIGLVALVCIKSAAKANVLYDRRGLGELWDEIGRFLCDKSVSPYTKVAATIAFLSYFFTAAMVDQLAYWLSAATGIADLAAKGVPSAIIAPLSWSNTTYVPVIAAVYTRGSLGFAVVVSEMLRSLYSALRNRWYGYVAESTAPKKSTRVQLFEASTLVIALVCATFLCLTFSSQMQTVANSNADPFGPYARELGTGNLGLDMFYLIAFLTSTSYYGSRGWHYIDAFFRVAMEDSCTTDRNRYITMRAFINALIDVFTSSSTIIANMVIARKEAYAPAIIAFSIFNNGSAIFPNTAKNVADGALHLRIFGKLLESKLRTVEDFKNEALALGISQNTWNTKILTTDRANALTGAGESALSYAAAAEALLAASLTELNAVVAAKKASTAAAPVSTFYGAAIAGGSATTTAATALALVA